jgi:hypothetical protein
MRASDLIRELVVAVAKHGDLPVYADHESMPEQEVDTVMATPPMRMTHTTGSTESDCMRGAAFVLSQW